MAPKTSTRGPASSTLCANGNTTTLLLSSCLAFTTFVPELRAAFCFLTARDTPRRAQAQCMRQRISRHFGQGLATPTGFLLPSLDSLQRASPTGLHCTAWLRFTLRGMTVCPETQRRERQERLQWNWASGYKHIHVHMQKYQTKDIVSLLACQVLRMW